MQGTESESALQPHTVDTRRASRTCCYLRLLLLGAVVATFGNGIYGQFHFDDFPRILNNSKLLSLSSAVHQSSRPLTEASFCLNLHFFGRDPLSFHVVNIILHALSALCLFELIRLILTQSGMRRNTPAHPIMIAFATSLLWALHPVQTEAVTYVVQRAELLATLFSLISLTTFYLSLSKRNPTPLLLTSVAACLLAMLSKPVAGVLPLLILLLDSCLISASLTQAFRLRWAYYGGHLAALSVLIFILLSPNESQPSTGLAAAILSPLDYWLNQQHILWHYLRLWFAPHDLCLDYVWLPESRDLLIRPAFANVLIGFALLWGLVRKWPMAIAFAASALLWLPSSSIVPIADLVAERRMYMPSIPFCLVCVCLVWWLLRVGIKDSRLAIWTASILFGSLAVVLMLLTSHRNLDYCSRSGMQMDVLSRSPHNMRARIMLMSALCEEGKLDQAYTACREALEWIQQIRHSPYPNAVYLHLADVYEPSVFHNLGRILFMQGETTEAVTALRKAARLKPDDKIAYSNLAAVHYQQGYYDLAIQAAEQAIRIDPSYAKPHVIIGMCYEAQHRPDLAEGAYGRAKHLDPHGVTTTGLMGGINTLILP